MGGFFVQVNYEVLKLFRKKSKYLLTKVKNRNIIYLDIYLNSKEGDLMGMSETLKAISDPVRREILELLKDCRKTAGEISGYFNLTGATVSYHLANLKKANLITETKQKNFIFYELNSSVFEDVLVRIYKLGGNRNEK